MENNSKHTILKTANLSIGYTSKHQKNIIANNLNVSLEKGKLVCLIGKNGIGKSTLLRTLTGVQSKLDGAVYLNSENLDNYQSNDLAKILSLVLTEKIPSSTLTVFELVALGRQPYTNWVGNLTPNDVTIVQNALEKTKTSHLAARKYYELSDGQLQKVMIARALAQNTDLIILDEPTAHLDIHHTFETFNLLKELTQKDKKTIIISTHEINLAIQIADILWLMTPDNFIEGTPNELIKNNSFNNLFDSDILKFDISKKQFIPSNSK